MKKLKNIKIILENLEPKLHAKKYYILSCEDYHPLAKGIFKEEEGITLFLEEQYLNKIIFKEKSGPFALISLNVYSDLNAIGLISKISKLLADNNISVNIISAFYHDHLFIPWEKKEEAFNILKNLSN